LTVTRGDRPELGASGPRTPHSVCCRDRRRVCGAGTDLRSSVELARRHGGTSQRDFPPNRVQNRKLGSQPPVSLFTSFTRQVAFALLTTAGNGLGVYPISERALAFFLFDRKQNQIVKKIVVIAALGAIIAWQASSLQSSSPALVFRSLNADEV